MVKLGIDNINDYMHLFEDKKVGLITNPTGYNSEFKSTIDILNDNTQLVKLYSPEHGIRGDVQAGGKVDKLVDEKTGIQVYSLYGQNRRPTEEMLHGIDILAFDIQDVGARFYTYIYTMAFAMQSSKEYDKEFVVFDRPNPIGGNLVEGGILNLECRSFIGYYPITQRYALTIGETAKMFNEQFSISCNLHIIPLSGWERHMYYDETGLNWIMPSPNMPTLDTAIVYTGTDIFEGTNISAGRGTTRPFELIGAPWLDADKLSFDMNDLNLNGVRFRPVYFTPSFSTHKGVLCKGVQLHVIDRNLFKPVQTGLYLLDEIRKQSGDKFEFRPPYEKGGKYMIDLITGSSYLRESGYGVHDIIERWEKDAIKFKSIKEKYHIY